MANLDRKEAVLLGLLYAYGKELVRTKLVKMTYLLDNLHFEQTGGLMTGYSYHWDYYGPNAVGNAIVETLNELCEKGFVFGLQRLTPYENYANYYKVGNIPANELPLSDHDWLYIHGITQRYGPMPRQQVVSESKKTLPMQGVRQFDVLQFKANPNNERLRQAFFSDKEFVRTTSEAMSGSHEKINLEDLRAEFAKSAMVS